MVYQYFVQYRHKSSGSCFDYVMYSELSLEPFKKSLASRHFLDRSSFELVKVAILR